MKNQKFIILILGLLTAIEPLSIDLYLPAFSQIKNYFMTDMGLVQVSLSIFIAGYAVGQLIWGTLSDKYGRKLSVSIGLLIYILSSVSTYFIYSIEQLWVLRFFQALGGCAGTVVANAIVADLFCAKDRTKVFSVLTLILGISPVLAPSFGTILLAHFDWHSIFHAMTIMGIVCLGLFLVIVPESYPQHKRTMVEKTSILTKYKFILSNKQFWIYTLIAGMSFSALMIYVSNVPFLLIEKYGLSTKTFSLIFSLNSLAIIVSAALTPHLTKNIKSSNFILFAAIFLALSAVIFAICVLYIQNFYLSLTALFIFLIPIGILFPLTINLVLAPFTMHNTGSASSLMGFIELLITFILSGIVGLLHNNTLYPMSISIIIIASITVVLAFMGKKHMHSLGH